MKPQTSLQTGNTKMSCTCRGYIITLAISQFIVTFSVLLYYAQWRPLFAYITTITDANLAFAFNTSNLTLVFNKADSMQSGISYEVYSYRVRDGNPYYTHVEPTTGRTSAYNPFGSILQPAIITMLQANYFFTFITPSILGAALVCLIIRGLATGSLDENSSFSDNNVKENLLTEFAMWLFVAVEQYTFYLVMASPVEVGVLLVFTACTTFMFIIICTVAVYCEREYLTHGFEMVFIAMLMLAYVYGWLQSKVSSSVTTAMVSWTVNIILNILFLAGHCSEYPVSTLTVVNCRCAYIIACCWLNIMLYIAA